MALQISYTDKEGDTHEQSYWVISDVHIVKKLNDNLITPIAAEDMPSWVKYAGYYGVIVLMGWRTKQNRDDGKGARFIHSVFPTGWEPPNNYHEVTTNEDYRFILDMESQDSLLTQAYNHLKTLDYFADAVEV